MNSIILGKKVKIRSLTSSRPWQHVLDIIYGYLLLGIKLSQNKKLKYRLVDFHSSRPLNEELWLTGGIKRLKPKGLDNLFFIIQTSK